jgi:hypothetical protein
MSDDPTVVREERTTVIEDTTPRDTVYVERTSNAGPWIIAAVVAVIAILAVLFLMNNRDEPVDNAADIAAALEANRAAGYIEGQSSAMANQMPTIMPAPVDTSGIERSAADAAEAARDARDAAERAADSVANPDTSVSSNTTN